MLAACGHLITNVFMSAPRVFKLRGLKRRGAPFVGDPQHHRQLHTENLMVRKPSKTRIEEARCRRLEGFGLTRDSTDMYHPAPLSSPPTFQVLSGRLSVVLDT